MIQLIPMTFEFHLIEFSITFAAKTLTFGFNFLITIGAWPKVVIFESLFKILATD
ncbi:hypothetical protein RhiirC2_789679 [Rhizophagus irregularis]|uniref:Uncharacterized protein n=1 Tax=Rhizophagus irregularis TaxID=588596 RepID=A0A2N1MMR6_9GLOM|nr:hypothetical protein RhiirC2_789679 [Rhizophagus irregularis]